MINKDGFGLFVRAGTVLVFMFLYNAKSSDIV